MTQNMNELCKFLEWDTAFFGYRIARVTSQIMTQDTAEQIDDWCGENAIDCIYFLAESQHVGTTQIAENFGYHQVDIRMVYEINLVDKSLTYTLPENFELNMATQSDIKDILPIVNNAFIYSRFYYDPNFTKEQSNNLYRTWVIRSVTENYADAVFVVKKDNRTQAFITCNLHENKKTGIIGLVGVADFAQGQGLGFQIIYAALSFFQKKGMKNVEVVTQGRNIAANRLYQKCGFRTSDMFLWYHKWFN